MPRTSPYSFGFVANFSSRQNTAGDGRLCHTILGHFHIFFIIIVQRLSLSFWTVSTIFLVRMDELSAGNGRCHRNLTCQQSCRRDLGELQGSTLAGDAKHLEALAAGPQRGAATNRRYGQGRQRYAHINLLIVDEFEIRDADGGVNNIGDVLAAGDEESGKTVGIV